jgi:hypothetical protein
MIKQLNDNDEWPNALLASWNYTLDCQLATVEYFAILKRPPAHETKRAIGIAQKMLDAQRHYDSDWEITAPRCLKIIAEHDRSVNSWYLATRETHHPTVKSRTVIREDLASD